MILFMLLGVAAGICGPVQTALNTKLRDQWGSPFRASLFSFSLSAIILFLVLCAMPGSLSLNFSALRGQPLWAFCGGLCGIIFLIGNMILFKKIGSLLTVIITVCGQLVTSLAIDALGLFGFDVKPPTLYRLIGALLVIIGVILATSAASRTVSGSLRLLPWYLFAAFVGASSGFQTAINGRVTVLLGSPLRAAFLSLIVSVITMTVVNLILAKTQPALPRLTLPGKDFPLIYGMGGLFGLGYLLANAALAAVLGNGVAVTLALLGSLIGGAVIDAAGLFGAVKKKPSAGRLLGIVIVLAGAVMIRFL